MNHERAGEGEPTSGTGKLKLAMVGSVLLSLGGVAYAVLYGVAADADRGGALAVALTFAILFLGRGTPEAALEAEIPRGTSSGAPRVDAELELARVRNALASLLDWQTKEKIYLTVASVVGTLAAGFGDVIAVWLGARR